MKTIMSISLFFASILVFSLAQILLQYGLHYTVICMIVATGCLVESLQLYNETKIIL